MSSDNTNRNARMLSKQKDELVRLLQTYFIRRAGRAVDVNGIVVDTESWINIAERLNECGPPKHVDEWKKSFYYMKLRVKTKKDQMIKRCNERGQKLQIRDFNEIDQKIVQMFYPENVSTDEETGISHENSNYPNQIPLNASDNVCFVVPAVHKIKAESSNENGWRIHQTDMSLENSNDLNQVSPNESDSVWYVIPEVNDMETETLDENGLRITRVVSLYDPENISELTEFIDPPINNQPEKDPVSSRRGQFVPKRGVTRRRRLLRRVPPSGRGGRKRAIVRRRQSTHVNRIRVVNRRITDIQRRTLLDLVQRNFLRTVGRYSGFNGVAIKRHLWESYAKELNTLGPQTRTPKGWKTVFTNIRLSTKKKIAKIRHERSRIGGEKKVAVRLSDMDDRIISMYGIDILDGQQKLGEGGFPNKKTLPYRNNSPTSDEMIEINDVNGFFADGGRVVDFDSQIEEDLVGVRKPDESRKVNILSNDLILPGRNLLPEINQGTEPHPSAAVNQSRDHNIDEFMFGGAELCRKTSIHAPASQGEIKKKQLSVEQGQSSRDTSINMPLSQFRILQEGQSSRDTSINIPLSQAKIRANQSFDHRKPVSLTAASASQMTHGQLDGNQIDRQSPVIQSLFRPTAQRDRSEMRSSGDTSPPVSAVNHSENAPEPQARITRGRNRRAQVPAENQLIDRNGTRNRNEHTSYAMVERSYNAQVHLNDHISRNHSEMVFMFTQALKEFASALRDHFNGNK